MWHLTVQGIPLFLMVDTYEDVKSPIESEPTHRCYCKVKVFRDKVSVSDLDEHADANWAAFGVPSNTVKKFSRKVGGDVWSRTGIS